MKFILKCNTITPFDEGAEGADFAMVDISRERAADLWRLFNTATTIKLNHGEFYAIELFDNTPTPFGLNDFPGDLADASACESWIDAPDDFEASSDFRMDTSTIRIKDDGVMWHFYEKHTNTPVETAELPWDQISRAAGYWSPEPATPEPATV